MGKRESSPVAQAYARCKPARDVLHKVARSMECIEDKAGVVTERFCMPDGTSVLLFATPHWWDVYAPITAETGIDATLAKIAEHAAACEAIQAKRMETAEGPRKGLSGRMMD